jgi:hypothetical protein
METEAMAATRNGTLRIPLSIPDGSRQHRRFLAWNFGSAERGWISSIKTLHVSVWVLQTDSGSFGLRWLIVLAVVGWLTTGQAWAHRDRGPDDPCRRQIGSSLLHLTLYQPQFDPVGEYCEEVPRAGKTILVVDFTAGELRQTPVSLELIETAVSGQSQTVLSLPAKTYELGVADTEALLNEGKDYRVRVLLEREDRGKSDVLIFPVRVAAWYRALLMPALLVIGLLGLVAMSVIRYYGAARQDESLTAWASRQSNRFA